MDIAKGKNRIDSVDILRAVGIILMIAGHVEFDSAFDRYIHSFHMPLFFLLSGSLFVSKSEISVGRQIVNKVERLLLPYFFYAGINYIFWLFLVFEPGMNPFAPLIRLVTYNTSRLPISGALWFLTALFFAEVYYIILDRLIRIDWMRTATIIILAVIASYFQGKSQYRLPLTLDTAAICMGFLEVGRTLKSIDQKEFPKKFVSNKAAIFLIGIALLVCNKILSSKNGYVNVKSGIYGFVPFFWVNAVTGTGACLAFSIWIDKLCRNKNFIKDVLVHIGRHSMIYLGLNQLVIMVVSAGYGVIKLPNNIYIRVTVIFAITVMVLLCFSSLCSRLNKKCIRKFLGI